MPTIDVPKLFRLWHSEMRSDDIAAQLGLTRMQLYRMKVIHKLPDREAQYNAKCHQRLDDPTEEEIAKRAAAVRAGWPPGEAEKRMGIQGSRVEVMRYRWCNKTTSFLD